MDSTTIAPPKKSSAFIMQEFIIGQLWLCDADPSLGLGTVMAADQRTVTIRFNAAGETRIYTKQSAPLSRIIFSAGDVVPTRAGWSLLVEGILEENGLLVYTGEDEQGERATVAETGLAEVIVLNRPADRLLGGRVDQDKWFRLRYQARVEYSRHRSSELYGLTGTRTSLIPHQLYIAHEVARRHSPRVLLADEVGLGKTIEAGLILHQQLLSERARRVLIVVPENLVHQWLVEMLRRFNLYFSIFDEERCHAIEAGENGVNPFHAEQLVLCSLKFLRDQEHRALQAVAGDWDLLVVDEAHHLHWTPDESSPEYRIIECLAGHTRGVLLLTATPEQTGKAGHFARLRLLDPDRYASYGDFAREEESYGAVARVVSALLDDEIPAAEAVRNLSGIIRDEDGQKLLAQIADSEVNQELLRNWRRELVELLVDRHGTGRVLFRNTRAAVKGFPQRNVSLQPLPLPELYADCLARCRDENSSDRQLLLSPEMLYMEWKSSDAPHWTRLDPRIEWLGSLLQKLRPEKVLLITAAQQTALDLAEALRVRSGIHAAVFHERMNLLERDRAAAYFADREHGCQLLVCSEIGSEGRNFQFAHHLVLFDLPLNPDLLEQRIGRLDRIGQSDTINIYVPYLENSAHAVMAHWYQEGLDAFTRTCPAGYPVFYKLQPELLAALLEANIEHHDMPDFIRSTRELCVAINHALEAGRDRLLEYNSCRPGLAGELKRAAQQQEAGSKIEAFMDSVFDCFGVHVEEHGRSGFIISPSEKMLAPYPGLPDEGMKITYSRATALANEDIQYLSWEHPMVITGLDMVLSHEFGNAVVCSMEHAEVDAGSLLLECLYVLEPAGAAGTQIAGYFPPAVIRVLIDDRGRALHDAIAHETINAHAAYVAEHTARQVIRMKEDAIREMVAVSGASAERQAPGIIDGVYRCTEQILDGEIARLESLHRVNKSVRGDEIEYFRKQRILLADIISTAKVRLDALRLIVAT